MILVSKLVVVWDLFINWLWDTPPGLRFSRPTNPTSESAIPVEIHDNHLHIQVMTPSARPLSMILDTGAEQNALMSG